MQSLQSLQHFHVQVKTVPKHFFFRERSVSDGVMDVRNFKLISTLSANKFY